MRKLLLHTCCAPCLTAVEEKLWKSFDLNIFWYNPNIEPKDEHDKRIDTLKNFLNQIDQSQFLVDFKYDYKKENLKWHRFIEGFENEPEGGKRCQKCIEFRLRRSILYSSMKKYDFITTTLTVSPHKDSDLINRIGKDISAKKYLTSDFKKNNGYQKSVELSKIYNLYRQNYCGCSFSQKNTSVRVKPEPK